MTKSCILNRLHLEIHIFRLNFTSLTVDIDIRHSGEHTVNQLPESCCRVVETKSNIIISCNNELSVICQCQSEGPVKITWTAVCAATS